MANKEIFFEAESPVLHLPVAMATSGEGSFVEVFSPLSPTPPYVWIAGLTGYPTGTLWACITPRGEFTAACFAGSGCAEADLRTSNT
jgi:H+/gluconate symporter-like permease